MAGVNRRIDQIEVDPTGRTSKDPGAKVDDGKAPLWQGIFDYFPLALEEVSMVSKAGAEKYTWKGWITVPDGINRYSNAMLRHLADVATGEVYDSEPGGTNRLHMAQVAWNALAVLELTLIEMEEEGYGEFSDELPEVSVE